MDLLTLKTFAKWIASTDLSEMLKVYSWIIPASQTVHIIALAILLVSALLICLNLSSVQHSKGTLAILIGNQVKVIWACMIVLLFTGMVEIIAEPARQFLSSAFQIKVLLLLLILPLTYLLANRVKKNPSCLDIVDDRPSWLRVSCLAYISTWIAIIICGRFIGYT